VKVGRIIRVVSSGRIVRITAHATHAHLPHDLVDERALPINNPTT
jgi:hypothetical protein